MSWRERLVRVVSNGIWKKKRREFDSWQMNQNLSLDKESVETAAAASAKSTWRRRRRRHWCASNLKCWFYHSKKLGNLLFPFQIDDDRVDFSIHPFLSLFLSVCVFCGCGGFDSRVFVDEPHTHRLLYLENKIKERIEKMKEEKSLKNIHLNGKTNQTVVVRKTKPI